MTQKEQYELRTEELILPFLTEKAWELVDTEYVKEGETWYLRVYIDKPDGITINDCELVSRKLSDFLDQEDFIEESYILEVSSPGLDRPLKKAKDYERSKGKEVEVKTYQRIDGEKEFTGILEEYDEDTVTLCMEQGIKKTFQKKEIARIRLRVDF